MDTSKLELLDKTKKYLRSVLLSAPRGVVARHLYSDYKKVIGKEIPFRELGYRNIYEFVQAQSDVVRIGIGATGEETFFPIADKKTSQIARFVASQRKPKVKKSSLPPPAVVRTPQRMQGFTKKSRYGPPSARSPYYGGNYRGGGGGSRSKLGKPFRVQELPSDPTNPLLRCPDFHSGSQRPSFNAPPRFRSQPSPSPSLFSYSSVSSSSHYYSSSGGGGGGGPLRPSSAGGAGPMTPLSPTSRSSEKQRHLSSSSSQSSSSRVPVKQRLGPRPSDEGVVVARKPSSSSSSRGGALWKQQSEMITIKDMNLRLDSLLSNKLVCVTGIIASNCREDKLPQGLTVIKFLLFSGYQNNKGVFPAVMLFFQKPPWDMKFLSELVEGVKLKVYGTPFCQINKKKEKKEPAITVKDYEILGRFSFYLPSSSDSSSPSSSRSSSPPLAPSSLTSSKTSSFSNEELAMKVFELLKMVPNGVWAKKIDMTYSLMLKENPPKNLLRFATSLPFVRVEEIAPDHPILYLVQDATPPSFSSSSSSAAPRGTTPPTLTVTTSGSSGRVVSYKSSAESERTSSTAERGGGPRTRKSGSITPTTPTEVAISAEKPQLPSTVEFVCTDEEFFDVRVVHIDSPTSFYVQLVGEEHSVKFQQLESNMNEFFSKNARKPVKPVKQDQLYGYCWDDEWCRALVRYVSGIAVEVMFPDYGNSDMVKIAELMELPREFHQLPFQAVQCCLEGVTETSQDATGKFCELALEKFCVAQVMDDSGSRVAVELLDCFTDGKMTINSILLQKFHPTATLTPELPNPGEPMVPVTLTDIDEDGVFTVQVQGTGLSRLQQLMTTINEQYKKPRAADFVSKVEEGLVCCGLFSADDRYYRVKVKKVIGFSKKVLVEYVDYGNEEELDRQRLKKPLENNPLFKLPFQAVKCKLHGLPPPGGQWTNDAIALAVDYLDCENMHLMVMKAASPADPLPEVKLLVSESEGSEEITDFNEMLLSQKQLFFNSQDKENVPLEVASPSSPRQQRLEMTNGVNSQRNVPVLHMNGTQKSSPLVVESRVSETVSSDGAAGVREPLLGDSRTVMSPRDAGTQKGTSPKVTKPLNVTKGVTSPNLKSGTVERTSTRGVVASGLMPGGTSPNYRATMSLESPEKRPHTGTKVAASLGLIDPKSPVSETGTKSPGAPLYEQLQAAIGASKTKASGEDDLESPIPSSQISIPIDELVTRQFKEKCALAGVTVTSDFGIEDNKMAAIISSSPSTVNVPTVLSSSPSVITPPISASFMSGTSVACSTNTSQLAVVIPGKYTTTTTTTITTSSSDSNFSPHTPSSSPSTFSPHTPLSSVYSPDSQSTPVHAVQQAHDSAVIGGGGGGGGISLFRREDLKFEYLSPNMPVSVTVTWVESPNNFVVQVLSNVSQLEQLEQQLSLIPSLPPSSSNDHNHSISSTTISEQVPLASIKPGLLCIANSSIDKRWYRALVVSEVSSCFSREMASESGGPEEGSAYEVTVEFLDYGGREEVQCSKVRHLPAAFSDVPFQGISASVSNVVPAGGKGSSWLDNAVSCFEELVLEKRFFAIEVSKDALQCSQIILLDTSGKETINVGDVLIKRGFASYL